MPFATCVSDSGGGVAAVDGECDADDEARSRAAELEDGRGDLAGCSEAADRLVADRLGDVKLAFREHVVDHRRVDRSGADGVDADAARRVLEGGALGEAEHAVL